MAATRRAFIKGLAAAAAAGRADAPAATPGTERQVMTTPAAWRPDFPALDQSINGHVLVYLDSAATTQRPRAVIKALADFYERDNANPSRSLHALARRAADDYDRARTTVARFINANAPDEVVFVRGTTEAINLAASAWGDVRLRPGDEVLLTRAEHYSNLLPWRLMAERTGAVVQYADVDEFGRVRVEDIQRKLTARTRLVAFSHVSNVVGAVNPAADICTRARAAGARVLIDGAQSVPHLIVDVKALGCDFLAFSSHKMLGPMGIGVLWARREVLEEMGPYQSGSNMAHDVEFDGPIAYEHGALRFGAGTPNVAGPVGLAAAIDYINARGRENIQRQEAALTAYALGRLSEIKGLTVLGPLTAAGRIPVFSFTVSGFEPAQLVKALDARGVALRAGDLASLPLLKHFGVRTALRASCYLYTDRTDIDRFVEALEISTRLKQ
jgi:cysteine desulfurase/selenocysteine lyase